MYNKINLGNLSQVIYVEKEEFEYDWIGIDIKKPVRLTDEAKQALLDPINNIKYLIPDSTDEDRKSIVSCLSSDIYARSLLNHSFLLGVEKEEVTRYFENVSLSVQNKDYFLSIFENEPIQIAWLKKAMQSPNCVKIDNLDSDDIETLYKKMNFNYTKQL